MCLSHPIPFQGPSLLLGWVESGSESEWSRAPSAACLSLLAAGEGAEESWRGLLSFPAKGQ